jgi:acyl-CoA thioester hydrolase
MSGKRFSVQDRVRWSDVDHAGIIYFGSYVRFFEIAETEMYRAMGLPYSEAFDVLDVFPVRAQFHCDFKSPAYLDDLLTVNIWISRIGNSSIELNFEITRALSAKGEEGEILVTGHCVQVAVGRETLKPRRVPDRLRTAMQEFLID